MVWATLLFCSGLSSVRVSIGGASADVTFAGLQAQFVGLDQVTVRLPRSLAGRGEVDVALTVDGQAITNPLTLESLKRRMLCVKSHLF